jgi:phosphoribosylanthranilate isomerase
MSTSSMPSRSTVKLKICCIASPDEADAAVQAGASALGLVSAMPSGPGAIDDAEIARIAAHVRARSPGVETFLLTCRTSAKSLIEQARAAGCSTLQICDALDDASAYDELRAALPGVKLVQVIHVEDEIALDEAFKAQSHVDALLLDSGRPNAAIKELGGTGRAHDWTLSHRIVGASPIPVWLAGGINADNVAQAIRAVAPHGIDVCSGVRTDGKLDAQKLHALVEAMKNAVV